MFVQYDEKGNILGFYATNNCEIVPNNTIKITEEEWRDCQSNHLKYKVNTARTGLELAPAYEELLANIRERRNELLNESDWTQLPDVALTESKKQTWRDYRQALRDFPATCNPNNPIWPKPPNVASGVTTSTI